MTEVASGSFRLNRRFFDEGNLKINKHRLSQREAVSYPTIHRYVYREELGDEYDIRTFSGDVLYAILVTGMGYSPEEAANLRLGDVFEIFETVAQ